MNKEADFDNDRFCKSAVRLENINGIVDRQSAVRYMLDLLFYFFGENRNNFLVEKEKVFRRDERILFQEFFQS